MLQPLIEEAEPLMTDSCIIGKPLVLPALERTPSSPRVSSQNLQSPEQEKRQRQEQNVKNFLISMFESVSLHSKMFESVNCSEVSAKDKREKPLLDLRSFEMVTSQRKVNPFAEEPGLGDTVPTQKQIKEKFKKEIKEKNQQRRMQRQKMVDVEWVGLEAVPSNFQYGLRSRLNSIEDIKLLDNEFEIDQIIEVEE